jgi:hypothetical protein
MTFSGGFTSNIGLPLEHGVVTLTNRSHELALSLFDPPPFDTTWKSKAQNIERKIITYTGLIEAAFAVGPYPIVLNFRTQGQPSDFTAILNMMAPDRHVEGLPDFLAIVSALGEHGVTPSELQRGILEALQQRGIRILVNRNSA